VRPRMLLGAATGGLTAVALGAFGAHGLRDSLTPQALALWRTAVDYQMFHSLALLALALTPPASAAKAVGIAGWLFGIGVVLFCGSLYLLAWSGRGWLGAVAPVGGLALLVGWAALAAHALGRWPGPRR
jgi:uncharacterized membrane protein YgdD (TMEM256/DUF423 family)